MLNKRGGFATGGMLAMLLWISAAPADANEVLQLEALTDDIHAIVGPYGNRAPENLGNNATFGFVVTPEGVVLIDAGGSYRGAAAIHERIRKVTDEPVVIVINTGGQDHRWLGNGYFKERGARIIASRQAVEDQRERARDQLISLANLIGEDALAGTEPVYADEVFEDAIRLVMAGVTFDLRHVGPAHTPGDTLVSLPDQGIVFTGDVVYVGRMLGVIPVSSSSNWITAFEELAALEPNVIVPGHGPATDLARARRDTLDYLVFVRELIASHRESGGDITDVGALDQTRFEYLDSFELLKGRNAQQVFEEMEWE